LIDYNWNEPKFRVLERNGDELLNKTKFGIEDISCFALIKLVNSINNDIKLEKACEILMQLIEHPAPIDQINFSLI